MEDIGDSAGGGGGSLEVYGDTQYLSRLSTTILLHF